MFNQILNAMTSGLMEFMTITLVLAMVLRYMIYKSCKKDESYYLSFTREIERKIEEDSLNNADTSDVENYLSETLEEIERRLPSRTVRSTPSRSAKTSDRFEGKSVTSLQDYLGGSKSLTNSIKAETNVFKAKHPPSFEELTYRLLNQDYHWNTLFSFIKIDSTSRLISALPGIFIVMGIFGTFLGIRNALPQIAQIDFANIDGSQAVLSAFVLQVTFAMKTSILGIICSLIITLSNTLSPINNIRYKTTSHLEHCLERIWYFIQSESTEAKRDKIFNEMLNALKDIGENTKQEKFASYQKRA